MVEVATDVYSPLDKVPGIVTRDAEKYCTFVNVFFQGHTGLIHVHRIKRVPDANL